VELRRENPAAIGSINAVEARFHEYAFKKPSWDPKKLIPKDRETADHSFPYMIAVALLEGDCSERQFRDELLFSPLVKDLMGRIRLATDPELTALWPTSSGVAIRLEPLSGETLERVCWYPPGHPRNPESDSMLETKFRRLAESVLSDDE
jgi:2-methylcitrate dehydratase